MFKNSFKNDGNNNTSNKKSETDLVFRGAAALHADVIVQRNRVREFTRLLAAFLPLTHLQICNQFNTRSILIQFTLTFISFRSSRFQMNSSKSDSSNPFQFKSTWINLNPSKPNATNRISNQNDFNPIQFNSIPFISVQY